MDPTEAMNGGPAKILWLIKLFKLRSELSHQTANYAGCSICALLLD